MVDLVDIDGQFIFDGWFDAAIGGTKVTSVGTGEIGPKSFWAYWTPNSSSVTHSVTYENTKGASNSNDETFVEGFGIAELVALPNVTGFRFKCWHDGGGNVVTSISEDEDDDITLYAQWTAVFLITYENELGANSNPTEYAEDSTFPVSIVSLSFGGFKFGGWYDNEYFTGAAVTKIFGTEGNVTLWAKWIKVSDVVYCNIKWAANTNLTSYDEGVGLAVTPLSNLSGFKFKGWFTAEVGGTIVSAIDEFATGTQTLYAQWITVSSIIYNDPLCVLNENPLTYDEGVGTDELAELELDGWEFLGWYDNPEFTGETITKIDETTEGTVRLYAKWKEITTTDDETPPATDDPTDYTFYFIGGGILLFLLLLLLLILLWKRRDKKQKQSD